jgi:hypothetical protein
MARLLGLALSAAMVLAAHAASAETAQQELVKACAGDIERLCAGVPPGEGRIKACMKAHITELSAPCFDTLLRMVTAEKEP